MPQSNQEQTAWRFQLFDTENVAPCSQDNYECELPPGVRVELVGPRRPRILGRKTQSRLKPPLTWPLYLAVLIAVLIVGGVATTWRQEQAQERAKTDKAISQLALVPQPTPIPPASVPAPGPVARPKESFANHPPAPRAALVKLPPPRARLVHLPEWKVGETRPVMMPYNLEVLATYKGRLTSIRRNLRSPAGALRRPSRAHQDAISTQRA